MKEGWPILFIFLSVKFLALGFEPDFLYPLENVTIAQGRDAIFTCVVNNLGGYRVSADVTPARFKPLLRDPWRRPSHGGPGQEEDFFAGELYRPEPKGIEFSVTSLRTHRPFYFSNHSRVVAWIKADTKAILAIHEHVITNNQRLSVTHNDYNTWTLNIRGVRREDRGQYMCQVNTDPMKSQTAFLEVVIPPDIIYEETSGDIMVPEGGSAKLVCKARGHPKPKVVWRREDGGDIIVRGGTSAKMRMPSVEGEMLTLSKVTRSEMGAYLCIAANGVPPSVSKRMMLHVHFHPLIQVPNQLVGAPIGADVVLHCHVEASPKAINYWTRESGEMIISNEKYKMTETSNSYYSVQMRLTIKALTRSDMGGYKCISKNSIGDAEGNIRLYEMEIPYVVKNTLDAPDLREEFGAQGSLREAEDEDEDGEASDADEQIDGQNSGPSSSIAVVSILAALVTCLI